MYKLYLWSNIPSNGQTINIAVSANSIEMARNSAIGQVTAAVNDEKELQHLVKWVMQHPPGETLDAVIIRSKA